MSRPCEAKDTLNEGQAGTVTEVHASEGDSLAVDQVILELTHEPVGFDPVSEA